MGKSIIVTEKFSVAQDFARVLGISGRHEGYIENDSYIITWCVGHLVSMSYPEKYDEALKKWSLDPLPFIPDNYLYEVIANVKAQFNVIKKLYHRSDVSTIYYAGDAGREGIYIQGLVRQEAGHNPAAKELVVWIDSQTDDEIKRGIREAKPFNFSYYQNLLASGYERAIEDYLLGINFSRILSLLYAPMLNAAAGIKKHTPIAVGRVMSCVLGMVVAREREIKNFTSTAFFKVHDTLTVNGADIEVEWKAVESSAMYQSGLLYNETGFNAERDANNFIATLPNTVSINKVEDTIERKGAPALFNLAEAQAECTKRFKISPDKTLETIQSLYEKKMVTYPRTDARVLSTAIASEIQKNIAGIKELNEDTKLWCDEILSNGWQRNILNNEKYVNDKKVTDHYAIIPTGQGVEKCDGLTAIEKDVYNLIVKRFLSIFYPPAEYNKVSLEIKSGNETFFGSSKVLSKPGYLLIAGIPNEDGKKQNLLKTMQELKEGQTFKANYSLHKGTTTPPRRYTSGSMVLAMENAGRLIEDEELREHIKSSGIGTSATRGDTIKKLVRLKYLALNEKTQILTPDLLGDMIYDLLTLTIPALLNPKMTASWEKGLEGIVNGTVTAEQYRSKLTEYIKKESLKMKNGDVKAQLSDKIRRYAKNKDFEAAGKTFAPTEIGAKCPICGKEMVTTPYGYACSDYKKQTEEENGCYFAIGSLSQVDLSVNDVKQLINTGKTDVISGFVSKSKGKFKARVMLKKDEDGKTKLAFDFSDIEPDCIEGALCPLCKGKILIKKFGYGCENYIKDDPSGCKFAIGSIAGKKIGSAQLKTLLTSGRVGPIKGFTSKSGKKFEASLSIDKEGKISFVFPEKIEPTESSVKCPHCEKNLIKDNWYYSCECGYKIPHMFSKAVISETEIIRLIQGEKLMKSGFTSKKNKKFSAMIYADDTGKLNFDFGE